MEPSLSDDILVGIVTRLPLKSFSRSKCVSKSWQSLLSNDYVRNKLPLIVSGVFHHSNSTLNDGPTYVSASNSKLEFTCLNFFPFRFNSTLIDCCNGLLLFYSLLTTTFHVCNPITKKHVTLPKPSKKTVLSILSFDPYHSQHFKVANFTGWHDRRADLELYDSESGSWAEHQVNWGIDSNSLSATVHYMDGVLYILAQPKHIVAMDLDAVTCSLIELPELNELPKTLKTECCIGRVGGRLHCSMSDGNQLKIWMLKDEDEGGWLLKHWVSSNIMSQFRVLALHPEREVVYLWVEGKLVAYDVCEKSVVESWELAKEEEKGYLIQVCAFPFTKFMEDSLASSTYPGVRLSGEGM